VAPKPPEATELARQRLRGVGLRVTPQRLAVLATLQAADGHHLSADDVWRRLRSSAGEMDRSTAYRALADLTDAGLLQQAQLGDGVTRFEIQDEAHHHAVCTVCGATEDVGVDAIERLGRQLRKDTGFMLGTQPLLLAGRCAGCASAHD
jgi:Fur family ferric uptake transcriptional regulator